jgi:hypothetical protein
LISVTSFSQSVTLKHWIVILSNAPNQKLKDYADADISKFPL